MPALSADIPSAAARSRYRSFVRFSESLGSYPSDSPRADASSRREVMPSFA